MPTFATSTPFHSPHSAATASAATIATLIGKRLTCVCTPSFTTSSPPIISAATAAAIATVAPTEMSMPRVAITSVMPIATSASGAARFRFQSRSVSGRPPLQMP